ncbi:CoA ester lyase [Nocardia neocaledoniensis NBRC 108232]|uniref:Citrate lyase subunit beta/citryl-CoA lyase n=1 Tax=Nocardia neocaledoniensis TaxID=236511 RepID=A0A317N238_9NOCA|nr:CoA ester lyase [Nocardia neocaledoniensis]PWV67583.1 citrate lyase subunit beta/citryl-CoA lyase [Nocardia neocaledoniensis]GEM31281.1 CoA ester lyase [Nocardia neocaledoniensis NBRC 108232]
MKPYRSMLFVPGHKAAWADKGIASGADALILDLEDSVPPADKVAARDVVAATIDRLAAEGARPDLWVRANPDETGLLSGDLEAVVRPGLTGLFLAKIYYARDIVRLDAVLSHIERLRGIPDGAVQLFVCFETAQSMADCEAIAAASPRVASLLGATGPNADAGRELGIEFTEEGLETLYMRSRIVLAARSNGLDHPMVGVWQDIRNIDGCRRFCEDNRRLGYRGLVAIHPLHVAVANEVFAPSNEAVDEARRLIAAFEEAQAGGSAAVDFEGQHVDIAHVKTARALIALAESVRVA